MEQAEAALKRLSDEIGRVVVGQKPLVEGLLIALFSGGHALVERLDPRLTMLAVSVLVLSACDAAFTLTLINHGLAVEANPLMRALLAHDVDLFVGAKLAVTGVGVMGLAAFAQLEMLGRFPLERAFDWLIAIYVGLIAYEITLLQRL